MRKVADAGLDDRWESGDVPTDVKEGDRMMQHALRASMAISYDKSPYLFTD